MSLKNIFYIIGIAIIFSGCIDNINNRDKLVLARVHQQYLYMSDIEEMIPKNISPRDSISFVRNIVNDWIKTNVLIYQAERNLPDSALDFSKQLKEYRNSLVLYKYESSLIDQNLDTIVAEDEIIEYYNLHLNDFELKENIVKAVYIIIENTVENEDRFDQIFNFSDSSFFDSLEIYGNQSALALNIDTTNWESFNELQKKVPIETYNIELFLKNKRFIKIVGEGIIYYVKFIDFKIKDEISPLDFKYGDIQNIIISKRKIKLAKKMREDIFNRAKSNNEFEVFYNQDKN